MNTPQQIATVKAIIDIKNKILHLSDWDEIAALIQNAIDIGNFVPAHHNLYPNRLDKTRSKAWNLIAVERAMKSVKERTYMDIETVHYQVGASLLMLSMAFVRFGLDDVIKIAA